MALSSEEEAIYQPVYSQVRTWQMGEREVMPGTDIPALTTEAMGEVQKYTYPVFVADVRDGWYVNLVSQEVTYSLLSDIRTWFHDIHSWIWLLWGKMRLYFDDLFIYIETLWNNLATYISDLGTTIKDEILGVANFLSNIYTWVVWNLVDDVTTFVINLFKPLTDAWDYVVNTLIDFYNEIRDAITGFLATPYEWITTALTDLWDWLGSIAVSIWDSMLEAATLVGGYIGTELTAFAPVVTEYLRDVLVYVWDAIKAAFIFVVEDLLPAAWESATGAIGWLRDEFTNLIGLAYDEIMDKATALLPITPERSVQVAAGMFGAAVGFGTLAHGMALGVEAVPNLKYMGVHYLSAFVARMGSFGTISSATMGVIAALAIREPFSYYMKSLIRPTQPREMDLQIMAVKPDINLETFRQGMKYQGYTDFWIDAFERTMYHEPSYFELSMLGEDEAATEDWLFTKARRSGYSEVDATVFVSSMIKKVTRDQRKEYYKQAFNAFKEGYISDTQFKEHLDHLDIRPEAKELATKAADLAYRTDLNKELISTYRRSFQDDIITEHELDAILSYLGLTEERVDSIIEIEWVKKEPKILKAERKEIETEWRKIQSGYSRLYIETFRRGLITGDQLETNLIAIGIIAKAAKATARHEALKLVPKPKPLEIIIPVIPSPPSPPVYEV